MKPEAAAPIVPYTTSLHREADHLDTGRVHIRKLSRKEGNFIEIQIQTLHPYEQSVREIICISISAT